MADADRGGDEAVRTHPITTTHQLPLDLRPGETTVSDVLDRIRRHSRDESEKGRWFENLVRRVLLENPEYEVAQVRRWADWPERVEVTGLGGNDIGIDLVAEHADGSWVAIQCKCYDAKARVGKGHIDSFLASSQISTVGERPVFAMRWIVATCPWTKTAEVQIEALTPAVRRIDFLRHGDDAIAEEVAKRPVRDPWPLQAEAIEDVVDSLGNHDRGRLIMACGTGKTFTSLRIAERIVPDGGRILFVAPSIALVSQARREWLRHTTRKLDSRVVCSDYTAGGRGESRNDIGLSELECAVTSDASALAAMLANPGNERTRVVFSTYQSLRHVIAAQSDHGAPPFDLALMDEAHRTTGVTTVESKNGKKKELSGFRAVHGDALQSSKRLYMTATPRIYTASSRTALKTRGIETVDMGDLDIYGPELHSLTFSKAVNAGMLSDYRVIVLGIHEDRAPPGVTSQLISLGEDREVARGKPLVVTSQDVIRLLGTSLAINGVTEGSEEEGPGRLHRTIAFSNSIARSSFYAEGMQLPELRRITTRRLRKDHAEAEASLTVKAQHLDASDSALQRNQALRDLAKADAQNVARVLFNVGLFSEGVDVPSLDAIVFMEPRQSQVDIVQAVGRVMRKSPGKRLGYIVVPIPIEPGADLVSALAAGTDGYRAVGKVLRALQSHDGRLAEDPVRFVRAYEGPDTPPVGPDPPEPPVIQPGLKLADVSQGVYAHVVAASGLGKPGLQVSQDIEHAVRAAARLFEEGELAGAVASALGLPKEAGDRNICTIAALLLANACLLHRRLGEVPNMEGIAKLNRVGGADDPTAVLRSAWDAILKRDYAPVFEPPLAVLDVIPDRRWAGHALRILAECANRVADSLSALGYDHAGPLYHRILPDATAYGAFYTNNLSALMLARLALGPDFRDWSDAEEVSRLRIMDPACGTGTLLMAALHVIKKRVEEAGADDDNGDGQCDSDKVHRLLVENVLCGLDVNRTAVQLAACNLTLGAPTVDYRRMNLLTLKHGPQPDGSVRAGSLDILVTSDREDSLHTLIRPLRTMAGLAAHHVDSAADAEYPLKDLDLVLMNPPFTNNRQRNRQFGRDTLRLMQQHELGIRDAVEELDDGVAGVIDANSVRTFFSPLAERMIRGASGILAQVLPATACTGPAGRAERRFLARRFHIERIVTSHDPRRINFSENTSIHECLLVARRWHGDTRPPTQFVSLRRMPSTPEEAVAAADAILAGEPTKWARVTMWPSDRVQAGDWTPVQWFNGSLADVVRQIEASPRLQPLGRYQAVGPAGRRIQDAYKVAEPDAPGSLPGYHSVSSKLRRKVREHPDVGYVPRPGKEGLAERYARQRSRLLVAMRMNTVTGRVNALWATSPSFGWWVPVTVDGDQQGRALAAWWNSTPVRLMLLNRRAKTLTYPTWQLHHLREVRIPTHDNSAWDALADAWEQVRDVELLPMREAERCKARRVIDEAAAAAMDVSAETVVGWRAMLAAEPTVTNRRGGTEA